MAGNATDGQLSVLDAVVLQDDQHYFPPYDCGLVVRPDKLKDDPALRQALVELAGRFTDQAMRKLNYQVDGEHRPVRDVAEQFLREAGLLLVNRRSIDFRQRPIRYRAIALRRGIPYVERERESPRRGTCGRLPSRSFPLL